MHHDLVGWWDDCYHNSYFYLYMVSQLADIRSYHDVKVIIASVANWARFIQVNGLRVSLWPVDLPYGNHPCLCGWRLVTFTLVFR
jgi:hypothetical protein